MLSAKRDIAPKLLEHEEGIKELAKEIVADYLERGLEKELTHQKLVEEVMNDMGITEKEYSKREISDIISDYGKTKNDKGLPPEVKKLRDLQAQLRAVSGIEDVMIKKILPTKLFSKSKVSDELRNLRNELMKVIREIGRAHV